MLFLAQMFFIVFIRSFLIRSHFNVYVSYSLCAETRISKIDVCFHLIFLFCFSSSKHSINTQHHKRFFWRIRHQPFHDIEFVNVFLSFVCFICSTSNFSFSISFSALYFELFNLHDDLSSNRQVKKRQQRVLMILDSKGIKYEVIDIAEPGKEAEKEFMQEKSTNKGTINPDQVPKHPLPPQIFADEEYCGLWYYEFILSTIRFIKSREYSIVSLISGSYDEFEFANETDSLEQLLKLAPPPAQETKKEVCNEN